MARVALFVLLEGDAAAKEGAVTREFPVDSTAVIALERYTPVVTAGGDGTPAAEHTKVYLSGGQVVTVETEIVETQQALGGIWWP